MAAGFLRTYCYKGMPVENQRPHGFFLAVGNHPAKRIIVSQPMLSSAERCDRTKLP